MTEGLLMKSGPEASNSVRDPYFDNLKGILIFLVVFGHLIEPWISQGGTLKGVYIFLYSFHMPLFVFVSGVFAKRYVGNPARFKKVLMKYMALYLLFDLAYKAAGAFLFSGGGLLWDPLRPYWITWFLLSFCCWHMALPLLYRTKALIPIAFLVGIGGGYIAQIGYFFSLSRTLYFLPFYVIGCHLTVDGIMNMASGWGRRVVALLVLIFMLRFSVFKATEIDPSWFYGSAGYDSFGLMGSLGGVWRALTYALTLGISLAVMMLVPKARFWLTAIGESSLVIYLFHGFLVRAMIALGYFSGTFQPSRSWLVFAMGLLSILLLASPLAKRVIGRMEKMVA